MGTSMNGFFRKPANGSKPVDGAKARNGFTLMELLIVISIMLILMLIAIPSYHKIISSANETSAMGSLQAIYEAQISYHTTYPSNGFAATLQALGGDPKQGPPSPTAAQILQADLAAGVKAGYTFNIVNVTKVTVNNTDQITSYEVTAVPQAVGKTGDRGFCMDQYKKITSDPAGGTNCTQAQ
jgi:type IV pilus assembly protein PilA